MSPTKLGIPGLHTAITCFLWSSAGISTEPERRFPYAFLMNLLALLYARVDQIQVSSSAAEFSGGGQNGGSPNLYRDRVSRMRVPPLLSVHVVAGFAKIARRAAGGDQEIDQ